MSRCVTSVRPASTAARATSPSTGPLERRHAVLHPAVRPVPRRGPGRRRLRSGRHSGRLRPPRRRDDPRLGVDQGRRRQHERQLVRHEQPDNPEHDQAARSATAPSSTRSSTRRSGRRRRSSARTTATSGSASTSGTGTHRQANWVNVTGGNTVLPNRPGARDRPRRLDADARPRDRLRGGRRVRREHADAPRATSSR